MGFQLGAAAQKGVKWLGFLLFFGGLVGLVSFKNGDSVALSTDPTIFNSMPTAPRVFDQAVYRDSLWQYTARYGKNKRFISTLQLQSLIALAYYPELYGVKIRFKLKNIKTTMQARPTTTFIFNSKKKRTYTIFIDKTVINKRGINILDAPFNAQIGILGHELAHIADYESCSNAGLLRFGVDYLDKKKKKNIEHYTDLLTIAHGLGWQLHDWAQFIFEDSGADPAYLRFKAKFYLKPDEIKKEIER